MSEVDIFQTQRPRLFSIAYRMLGTFAAVVRLLVGFTRSAQASGIASRANLHVMDVNSEPAILIQVDGEVEGVFVLSIEDNSVAAIRAVRNPDKLAYLKRQLGAP